MRDKEKDNDLTPLLQAHGLTQRGAVVSVEYGLVLLLREFSRITLRQDVQIKNLLEETEKLRERIEQLETHSHYHYQGQQVEGEHN